MTERSFDVSLIFLQFTRFCWEKQLNLAGAHSGAAFCHMCQIKQPPALDSCLIRQDVLGRSQKGGHSHSTNPIIWGCIFYAFTCITFANLLIFYPLFLAANFLSIKIVSQKAGEYNYLLHRFPGYSAIENTLLYRKFSFIALDAFRSDRSRHPWTL